MEYYVYGRKEMTKKQNSLINELINFLPENEKSVYREIVNCMVGLGYIPQKQKVKDFDLSFKHKINNKVIAKVGIHRKKGNLRIKFFACRDVPEKFIKALLDEAVANENRYSMEVTPPDRSPMLSNGIMKKCTSGCTVCTGGGMRYYYRHPNGMEIYRCGAYPVVIPDIDETDMDDLKRLIMEQHNYFQSIA